MLEELKEPIMGNDLFRMLHVERKGVRLEIIGDNNINHSSVEINKGVITSVYENKLLI